MGKSENKVVVFLETIAASDLKVRRSSHHHVIEYMKVKVIS